MDTLAARLREAFLGTETGEAVPFDELKDAVRARWQRVADAAREVPPEGIALAAARERGRRAAIRVPFSDAQIERMAEAAHTRRMRDEERTKQWKDLPLFAKDAWRHGIRAALAAGGLEPCAVPEYEPADVALRPSYDEVEKLARVMLVVFSNNTMSFERTHYTKEWMAAARAAIAHLRPTQGHVLRDRLVDAEAKIERQRAELKRLNALVADLRAEVDEDNAAAASVNDLLVQVQNLTAERDHKDKGWNDALKHWEKALGELDEAKKSLAAESEWVRIYKQDRDDALAELRERDSVAPPADQVEALARVFRDEHAKVMGTDALSYGLTVFCAYARAAIAHLSTRPEGLPDEHVLAAIMCEANGSTVSVLTGDDGYSIVARAALTALRPWLRDPVGCELDVTADVIEVIARSSSRQTRAKEILDLCRSRIRPVYECKECAKADEANHELCSRIEAARAALEGE